MDCFSLRIFAHLTKLKDLENGDAFVSSIHRLLKSLEKKGGIGLRFKSAA